MFKWIGQSYKNISVSFVLLTKNVDIKIELWIKMVCTYNFKNSGYVPLASTRTGQEGWEETSSAKETCFVGRFRSDCDSHNQWQHTT